ncbi:phospho-N-acetylmuramoyl-pentapeptide-transferase [candidate division WOR-3 bacterium JGI_Cruoil_03_44_89]|uniref:Phospho-N-acetylmuramoyl-pentapeptide-transferase n=1 Tax=candidate division WOR-3 bacterium JGI_Cruoil_03_44_89 TaxID=1973748 RepID=A0A235BTB2_UNCW3|nr:MAG: phospho-N-acetylmuramoyl-pentapeptide-transferase [candidate division WOR-3 bacterium JGI_Cruoil_03_44_89]
MLYHFLYPLATRFGVFNLFRYITFRAAYAGATALIIMVVFGPHVIKWLKYRGFVSGIREATLKKHEVKKGTPLAGPLILLAVIVSSLLWADVKEPYVWVMMYTAFTLATLGLVDDVKKVRRGRGMLGKYKFMWQMLIAIPIALYMVIFSKNPGYATMTTLLFIKNIFWNLGVFYIPFVVFIVVATSNSVNIADGIDGLACGLAGISAGAYVVLSYLVGHYKFASYLNILFIPGGGEVAVVLASVVGTAIGFLWFNAHPAEAFMGDMSSLPLGGLIGVSAILIKQEILLILVCGVFVAEALSVIIQVLHYKRTKRRFFKMAPLHHHFELMGVPECKLVVRFWIVGILFTLIAISTLKIR